MMEDYKTHVIFTYEFRLKFIGEKFCEFRLKFTILGRSVVEQRAGLALRSDRKGGLRGHLHLGGLGLRGYHGRLPVRHCHPNLVLYSSQEEGRVSTCEFSHNLLEFEGTTAPLPRSCQKAAICRADVCG